MKIDLFDGVFKQGPIVFLDLCKFRGLINFFPKVTILRKRKSNRLKISVLAKFKLHHFVDAE